MSTLYKPVLIETAEQAEALAVDVEFLIYQNELHTRFDGVWEQCNASYRLPVDLAEPATALVPIEAEEETRISETRSRWRGFKESRLVTPWEEA